MKKLIRSWRNSLTQPEYFYKNEFDHVKTSEALALGLISIWIQDLLEFLVRLIKNESYLDSLNKLRSILESVPGWRQVPESIWLQNPSLSGPTWVSEAFPVILSPFSALAKIGFGTLALWVGVSLLFRNSPRAIRATDLLKISALSLTPLVFAGLLSFLPFGLGGFIAWIFATYVLIVALAHVYQVSSARALAAILLPKIILFTLMGMLILGSIVILFGSVAALLSS